MRNALILLIGGKSKRANLPVKKQYYEIDGFPVFVHTLKSLMIFPFDEIIIVIPKEDEENVSGYLKTLNINYTFAYSGDERVDSVYNGMKALEGKGADYVFVHDGVRPLITKEEIYALYETVKKEDACILAAKSVDTVKVSDDSLFIKDTPKRATLYRAFTPQVFSYEKYIYALKSYYAENPRLEVTDDASVYSAYAGDVKLVLGNAYNIKITKEEDIHIYKALKEILCLR